MVHKRMKVTPIEHDTKKKAELYYRILLLSYVFNIIKYLDSLHIFNLNATGKNKTFHKIRLQNFISFPDICLYLKILHESCDGISLVIYFRANINTR